MAERETPLERAIREAGGITALVRRLNETLPADRQIKSHMTVYQWTKNRVPSDYCPDIEAVTNVTCEELRPDVNWSVLRKPSAERPTAKTKPVKRDHKPSNRKGD